MVAERIAYLKYLRDVLGVRVMSAPQNMKQQGEAMGQRQDGATNRTKTAKPGTALTPAPAPSAAAAKNAPVTSLEDLRAQIEGCTRCKLSKGRNKIVFGAGNPKAKLMFVGEGPGEEEDKQGLPFIGRAGQLLTKMIEAMGLSRDEVFIANVVKCRPPENRNPEPDEIAACSPFLHTQIALIQPKVIVALGTFATQTLLGTEEKISKLRGKPMDYRGTKLLPTFHPAYLLRNPSAKKEAWEDLQAAMDLLGLKAKAKK
jgi:DNA polymerase